MSKEEDSTIYEKCYIPEKDEGLKRLGIEVCARTIVEDKKTKIRVVFKRGGKESTIDCIKTIVGNIEIDPTSEHGIRGKYETPTPFSTEDVSLTPEDSFWAIKSFTENLVDTGIINKVIESFEHRIEIGSEPAWFNQNIRSQIVRALTEIAPEESKEMALSALEYISADDEERFKLFSTDFEKVICDDNFSGDDVIKLDKINGGVLKLPRDILRCLINKDISDDFLFSLAERNNLFKSMPVEDYKKLSKQEKQTLFFDQQGIVEKQISPVLMRYLAKSGNLDSKYRVIKKPNVPDDVIQYFINEPDEDQYIRVYIARNIKLSEEHIKKLADDIDEYVRLALSDRTDLPEEIVHKLMNDSSDKVRSNIIKRGR